MNKNSLEERCKQAVLKISDDVKDIKDIMEHIAKNYREDYYALNDLSYQKVLRDYPK